MEEEKKAKSKNKAKDKSKDRINLDEVNNQDLSESNLNNDDHEDSSAGNHYDDHDDHEEASIGDHNDDHDDSATEDQDVDHDPFALNASDNDQNHNDDSSEDDHQSQEEHEDDHDYSKSDADDAGYGNEDFATQNDDSLKYDQNSDAEELHQNMNDQDDQDNYHDDVDKASVESGFSKVAMSKSRFIMILLAAIVAIYFIIHLLMPYEEKHTEDENKKDVLQSKTYMPSKLDNVSLEPQIPALPETPKLVVPTTPPATKKGEEKPKELVAPKAPEAPPALPAISEGKAFLTPQEIEQRRKSNMVMMGGNANPKSNLIDSGGEDYNSIPLTANQIKATRIGNLNRVIAQGKIIDAILETAVNTEIPGMVRGLVSHDVYSENGMSILIPRGSRIIGQYDSKVAMGEQRVEISWNRLIRPDGIDIALNSPGTDPIGGAGVQGKVRNKYLEIFSNSLMLSIINIGTSGYMDTLNKKRGVVEPTTTTYLNLPAQTTISGTAQVGGTTVSGSTQIGNLPNLINNPATVIETGGNKGKRPLQSQAEKDELKRNTDIAKGIIEKHIDALKPVITINQGTKIKVFVAHDLVFPGVNHYEGSIIK